MTDSSKTNRDQGKPKNIVKHAIQKLAGLLHVEGRLDKVSELREALRHLDRGIFRLVVMGEIKKGKSTFINALLGEENLLPSDVDVATSTVYKLIYGKERRFKVFFLPDSDTGRRSDPLLVPESQLAEYGTEKGNPNNEKRVDFIGVELPAPLLAEGLAIIDTPGVGGLYKAHRDITWRYAPNADAIFFVLDSAEAVLSADEIKFLQELTGKVTKRVFFVQTKTDAADEETVRSWEKRNKEILRSELGVPESSLVYFPVSSTLKIKADSSNSGKRLRRSGFSPLLQFLHHNLMPRKEEELARDVAVQAVGEVARMQNELKERERIFSKQSEKERDALNEEFRAEKKRFDDWAVKNFTKEINGFLSAFEKLRRNFRTRMQEELDPQGPLVTKVIEQVRSLNAKTIIEQADDLNKQCLAEAAATCKDINDDFASQTQRLIQATLKNLDIENALSMPSFDSAAHAFATGELYLESGVSGVDKVLAVAPVVSVGALFVSLLGLAAVGPLAIVALAAGGCLLENVERKESHFVLRELEAKLRSTLMGAARRAVQAFDENAIQFQEHFQEKLTGAKKQREEELRARIKEISDANKLSAKERENEESNIKRSLKEVTAILDSLQSVARKR